MRVEVFDEGNGCDEFLFGSYHNGEVDGQFNPQTLKKVQTELHEQHCYITGLLENMGAKSDYSYADAAVFGRTVGDDGCVEINGQRYYTGRPARDTVVVKYEASTVSMLIRVGDWVELETLTDDVVGA